VSLFNSIMPLVALTGVAMTSSGPQASAVMGVTVLTAEYGTLGARRKLDISQRLQALCGTSGESCNVFCSETSFGLYRLGRRPICRVTYRCPDASTRSVEAAKEELLVMRCPVALIEEGDEPAEDQPQPPPYLPPPGS
jgi:hypothetical protein